MRKEARPARPVLLDATLRLRPSAEPVSRPRRLGIATVLAALLACWPAPLFGQMPAGPEFRVNTYTTGGQYFPSVAMDVPGNFVVSWESDQDGSFAGVFGQRFASSGTPRGAEFRVNSYTTGRQRFPSVGMDTSGNFVVAWASDPQAGHGAGIFGQRYDASGTARGSEFRVNSYTTSYQVEASVAVDAAGNFIVAWESYGHQQDRTSFGIFAQRFDAAGAALGAEFRVNTYTTNNQDGPSVAVDAVGNFVVAWQSRGQDGSDLGIFAQRFDAAGTPRGAEFRVNSYTTSHQFRPSVAVHGTGDFVVAWTSSGQDGSDSGVFGQRFDAAGMPQGAEFRVNTYTVDYQFYPSVAVDEAGNFVVAWTSYDQDGSSNGVFAQRFDATGTRRGAEFRVNTYTTGSQWDAQVAADGAGNFVVAWRSFGQDGSVSGVFAQRFGGLQPATLGVDGPGNSVWEPGESVELKPSWRNVSGAAQTFGGGLINLTGPPGASYAITDGIANYGTVTDGATAPCTDCYGVTVSSPPSRPATHWDASALESITPDAQGQIKRWLLHVGDSFTDVPTASPFYRFIETLLHKGITAGCTATGYCPLSSTTREQMAVFVLVSKEGAGYAPPACVAGSEMFADVPASSPFCRWIEELTRRGVVAGCGGGNYCPISSATREQMAVFVLRTLDPTLNPPACVAGSEMFADVPASSAFCRWIEELARRNVVTGCGSGNYCPTSAVTREQMSVFLAVTFGLTLYGA